MADPVTLAIGATVAAAALKAKGQIDQSKAQARQVVAQSEDLYQQANLVEQSTSQLAAESQASLYNAELARQNAEYIGLKTAEEERRYRVDTARQMGELRVKFGASGVTLEGSVMDVLQANAAGAEINALTLRHRGQVEALAYTNQEALERFRASQYAGQIEVIRGNANYIRTQAARTAGEAGGIRSAGNLAAVGTLLSGATSAYGMMPASSAAAPGPLDLDHAAPASYGGLLPSSAPNFTGSSNLRMRK